MVWRHLKIDLMFDFVPDMILFLNGLCMNKPSTNPMAFTRIKKYDAPNAEDTHWCHCICEALTKKNLLSIWDGKLIINKTAIIYPNKPKLKKGHHVHGKDDKY